jgi:hypothetical protein
MLSSHVFLGLPLIGVPPKFCMNLPALLFEFRSDTTLAL